MNKLIELTALWEKKDKNGDTFYYGKLGKMNLVIMKNRFKKDEKHPDYRVFLAEASEDKKNKKSDNELPF